MFLDFLWAILGKIVFFTGAIGGKNSFPKPLLKEEEEKYLALARRGDKEAKDVLIRHNMRLVAHIVKKYTGAAETDDLISVGSIGLIKAINTYEPGHGTALATYTARCIENEILMLIRTNKKHKNNLSLSDPVGTDKDGNELTLMDLLFEKEDCIFEKVERSVQREAHFERTGVYGIMSEICFKGRSTSAAKGSGKDAQDFQIVYFENRKEGDRETARSASFGRFF